ncbi:MAG: HEAT repeat domain-containing protein [Candidatus Cloacimonetes bacterium]|nr:HEAT repeat domain-containing protein [Candidatus Cloacimonadota bacterium]
MKDKNQTAKEKKGFTTEVENNLFAGKSDIDLISLLQSNNPKERTSSTTILGQRKSEKAISALCEQLAIEKALYSKIAISEALGEIGKPAISMLIKYLGEIGSNQHKTLPRKIFNKWRRALHNSVYFSHLQ